MKNYNGVTQCFFFSSVTYCDPDVLENCAAIKDMCWILNTTQWGLLNLQANTIPRRCLTYTEILCISLCLFWAKPKAMVFTYPSHSTHKITTEEKNKYSAFPSLKYELV